MPAPTATLGGVDGRLPHEEKDRTEGQEGGDHHFQKQSGVLKPVDDGARPGAQDEVPEEWEGGDHGDEADDLDAPGQSLLDDPYHQSNEDDGEDDPDRSVVAPLGHPCFGHIGAEEAEGVPTVYDHAPDHRAEVGQEGGDRSQDVVTSPELGAEGHEHPEGGEANEDLLGARNAPGPGLLLRFGSCSGGHDGLLRLGGRGKERWRTRLVHHVLWRAFPG